MRALSSLISPTSSLFYLFISPALFSLCSLLSSPAWGFARALRVRAQRYSLGGALCVRSERLAV